MPTIRFVNEKKEIQVPVGANLRNEAIRAGVQVYSGMEKVFIARDWAAAAPAACWCPKGWRT